LAGPPRPRRRVPRRHITDRGFDHALCRSPRSGVHSHCDFHISSLLAVRPCPGHQSIYQFLEERLHYGGNSFAFCNRIGPHCGGRTFAAALAKLNGCASFWMLIIANLASLVFTSLLSVSHFLMLPLASNCLR